MDVAVPARPGYNTGKHLGLRLTYAQFMLLLILLGFGSVWLATMVETAPGRTVGLFVGITVGGVAVCRRTEILTNDSRLRILSTLWFAKIAFTLIFLFAVWIPGLDPLSIGWGYDPQRYYQDAWDLIQNDWNPVVSANYQGIIFYYAFIFRVFGHNPVIPALINALVTLLATTVVIRCAYRCVPIRSSDHWKLAGLLLVPEVLWYDILTSRETLAAALIIFATLPLGQYLVRIGPLGFARTLIVALTALVGITAVRTTMIIPAVISVVIIALLTRTKGRLRQLGKPFFLTVAVAAFLAGPMIQRAMGGYNIDYMRTLLYISSFERNVAAGEEWGERSIGLLLAPSSPAEFLLYTPPRMLLYILAPIPQIALPLDKLAGGQWNAWQHALTLLTSLLMVAGFPYVLAGTAMAWQARLTQPALLVLPATFWVVFAAVGGGNIIIHERYRLGFSLLLFASMWLGYSQCTRRRILRWSALWYGLLLLGGASLMAYKGIL